MKSVQIQLTTLCNERCVFCRKYEWPRKHIDPYVLEEKIKKYQDATFQFSGGEPLMYKHLDFLNYLINKYNLIYKVYSNMTLKLNKQQEIFLNSTSEISVSLDGINPNTYNKIRRPQNTSAFTNLIANIINYSNKSKACMVVTSENYKEIKDVVLFGLAHGIKCRFYNLHTNLELALTKEQIQEVGLIIKYCLNEYPQVDTNLRSFAIDILKEKNKLIPCNVKNNHRVIDEDGREYTCCYAINDNGEDINGKYQIENLPDYSQLLPEVQYEYCSRCTRYKFANKNWETIKNVPNLFL